MADVFANGDRPNPPHRVDTSMCDHLRGSLDLDATVKREPREPEDGGPDAQTGAPSSTRSKLEKRFGDVVRWGGVSEGVKRRKTTSPACQSCESPLTRPWACLTCSYVGCMHLGAASSSSKNCMQVHWQQSGENSVDPATGAVFCSLCNDTIYPDTFEAILRETRTRVEETADISREGSSLRGRGRGPFRPWPGNDGASSLDDVSSTCRGLRPLLNLSQTCFLSAILQSLIHNPLLKAYFLSEKHNRHLCSHAARGLAVGKPYLGTPDGSGGAVGPDREKGCMCCELDRAFEEFYNDDKSPFGPVTMLYSMWHASAELEGYGQQDAHSFFLAALDQIHAHARGQMSSCNCIAHQTFAGSLLSLVSCSKCSTTSTTIDPILDVQLDFPAETPTEGLTLAGMLRRFCAPEKVGEVGKGYECDSCGGGSGVVATRKLMLRKLPPVLSFQLKRFAHNATSTKVELPVRFTSKLDMRPYVDPGTTANETTDGTDENPSDTLPDSLFSYDLFAVVTHEGKLDNGHYWADVRSGDEWWHCDDDKVTPTTLSAVLAQKAYMLFYIKRSLAYTQPMKKLLSVVGAAPVQPPPALSNGTSTPGYSTASNSTANEAKKGLPVGSSVGGKSLGGKGHPIRGMEV
ncbi:hypothetical protein EHS25_000494 [Saitozyma podzolica]|uniref:USP domain-containing protein n=1 Tax=Saitozyma podzolica TaxID=1890683 RepID=A0A427YWE4_9TREE|nr:hypothetical protein EHS25_000494 [Saitozyma podzolica]